MIRLDEGRLDEVREAGLLVIYKHSPTCWLSSVTMARVKEIEMGRPDLQIYLVDVVRQRPLSQALARELDVPHASPQLILVRDGRAVWDASHMGVSEDGLLKALECVRHREAAGEGTGRG